MARPAPALQGTRSESTYTSFFGPIWPPVAGSIRRPKSSVSPEDSSSVRRRGLPVLSSVLDVMRVRPSRKSCSNRMASGLQAIMADTGRERTISSPLATV